MTGLINEKRVTCDMWGRSRDTCVWGGDGVAWPTTYLQVVEEVLSDEDGEALRDVDTAYARFLAIDVLDVTAEVHEDLDCSHTGLSECYTQNEYE